MVGCNREKSGTLVFFLVLKALRSLIPKFLRLHCRELGTTSFQSKRCTLGTVSERISFLLLPWACMRCSWTALTQRRRVQRRRMECLWWPTFINARIISPDFKRKLKQASFCEHHFSAHFASTPFSIKPSLSNRGIHPEAVHTAYEDTPKGLFYNFMRSTVPHS